MVIAKLMIDIGAATGGSWIYARTKRAKRYRELAARVADITVADAFQFKTAFQPALPDFGDRLVVVLDFLPEPPLAALRAAAERIVGPERSYVPMHKKGGTIAYETLIALAPDVIALYHSAGLTDLVSRIVGERVYPTPINDQSSLSVLFYDRPGDHIGWHFDHNFYCGRHFTVLLAILNEGRAEGGLSHAVLKVCAGAGEVDVRTPANTLVIFEGAKVYHKVTPILDGERRMMLSMTYCTDPRAQWWQVISRRVKDTAFFGVRALWT